MRYRPNFAITSTLITQLPDKKVPKTPYNSRIDEIRRAVFDIY